MDISSIKWEQNSVNRHVLKCETRNKAFLTFLDNLPNGSFILHPAPGVHALDRF